MRVLISACLVGDPVRWNGANKLKPSLISWCESNNIELVPVCPENEIFGTPRPPIRLIQIEEKIRSEMNGVDVNSELESKAAEIYERFPEVNGFIGISNSPSCGMSVGVKNLGSRIRGSMHRNPPIHTTEAGYLNTDQQRTAFLKKLKSHE